MQQGGTANRDSAAGGALPQRICLLVLGMHRSGTSAVTSVISLLGADLPKTLLGAGPGNARGHWESAPLVAHHDRLLGQLGSRWDDWRKLDIGALTPSAREEAQRAFHTLIEEEYAASPLLVLKEPRICRFAPFVVELLAARAIAARHVLVLRNPLAVVASLGARNAMTPGFAALVWLRHVLDAEAATRHAPRAIVSYENLLLDWRAAMRTVGARVGIRWPCPIQVSGPQVEAFLSAELQHHAPSRHELAARGDIADWVKAAYGALRALERDADDEAACATLDAIAAAFDAVAPTFAAAMFPELAARDATAAERQAEQARAAEELRAAAVAARDGEIAVLRGEVAAARAVVAEREAAAAALHALYSSRSWRVTRPMRGIKRLLFEPGFTRSVVLPRVRQSLRRLPVPMQVKHRVKTRLTHAGLLPAEFDTPSAPSNHPVAGQPPSGLAYQPGKEYLEQVFALARPVSGITGFVPRLAEHANLLHSAVKIIAFYLPQFHPIPENDRWWGKGFTEWTNVSKAVPQFVSHYQPRLPADLGFYDLRMREIQIQQMEMAKQYGVHGFCYHYYWFGGKKLLDLPLMRIMEDATLDLPFCICWANENWTRRWDGQDQDILMAQSHSPEDDLAFIQDLAPVLRDPRYIRFNGRPVLIVYRASLLPEARATATRWRQYCMREGIGNLYLVAVQSFDIKDPRPYGFDAALEFPPHQGPVSRINDKLPIINPSYAGNIYDYAELARYFMKNTSIEYALLKTVVPSWDNEARTPGRGHTFWGASPEIYARWLRQACAICQHQAAHVETPPFVFVNAWNEWAEGAYLEPDRKLGYAYLHATTNVLREFTPPISEVSGIVQNSQQKYKKRSDTAIVVHLYYEDLAGELAEHVSRAPGADVFISLRSDLSAVAAGRIVELFPHARLSISANRGRDIYPFLQHLQLLRTNDYKIACKVHSKKSTYREDGPDLRATALRKLLSSPSGIAEIVDDLRRNADLGLVAPEGSLIELKHWDRYASNKKWLDELLPRIGASHLVGNYDCVFPAGSMFWFKMPALEPLLRLGLRADDFEDEVGQIDGTLAHSVERLFAVAAQVAGFRVVDSRKVET